MITVKTTKPRIRSAKNSDIPAILRLERKHGEGIWNREELYRALNRQQEVVTMIAIRDRRIVGLLMYEIRKTKYDVITLVCENGDFDTIGRVLIRQMVKRLSAKSEMKVLMSVRESDLKSQLFLRDMKFICFKIVKAWYRDYVNGKGTMFEDAYRFKYERKQ